MEQSTTPILETTVRPTSILTLGLFALSSLFAVSPAMAETIPIDRISHIHDLAVDPNNPSQLYIATHEGLFLTAADGTATRIGDSTDDLMALATDMADASVFYASGHPPVGGNLGVLASRDHGVTWENVALGTGGPVDFHAMAVSRADPETVYGMFEGLQVSQDGGKSWRKVGPLPEKTFALAGSARDRDTVYAAAMGGLFFSRDGGAHWNAAFMDQHPATLVAVSRDGRIYTFLYGVGLVVRDESAEKWEVRSTDFGDRYPVKMAIDPTDPDRIHVVADTGAIVTSKDGGRHWVSYMGHDRETPELIAGARKTFEEYCQSCHGENGVGERPEDGNAQDEYGFVAPALDNSAHGWHHSDGNLAYTILNGSPRNPRMLPFKDMISEEDAKNTVAYVKSLWSFSSLACQGALHMKCMH